MFLHLADDERQIRSDRRLCVMPAREFPGGPAGRTWRLPMRWRLMLIAIQALIPGMAAATFWVPHTGDRYLAMPLSWLLVAVATIAWLTLAGRAWRESVTLTPDMLVVRNVFRTWRVPVAEVTGVSFRRGAVLAITVAGPAAPAGGGSPGRAYAGGRHAGRGVSVAAVKVGTAYWSGRWTDADAIANIIAVTAGLRPRQPRKEIISRRAARVMLPAGMGLFALAVALGVFSSDSHGLVARAGLVAAKGLALATMTMILVPAGLATFDRFCGRWRDQRGVT
jgi:hypothetical protein